jgi:hypothetical protein
VLQSMESGSVLVVESRTDSSHFARTFKLSELLLGETTSDLSAQLNAAPSRSTFFLPSPPPIIPLKAQQEIEEEYRRKLSEPCNIPVMRTGPKQGLFESPAKVEEIFSGTDLSRRWRRFHKVFGEDAELDTFSRVAFDRARQYALVHVSSGLSSVAGGGDLYLLSRRNGKWSIE